jgi:hypothetical protein
MTALDEYDAVDPAFLQRITNLPLEDGPSPVASPPHTPPRRSAPPYVTSDSTVYEVESPRQRGLTTEWFVLSFCVCISADGTQVHRRHGNSRCPRWPCSCHPALHPKEEKEEAYRGGVCRVLWENVWSL